MKFKELRKQNQKSQTEIANLLNVRQTTYSSYELEETEPNIQNLIKLADYYNVSIDYLVDRKRYNDIGYLSSEQFECVNLIKQLNEQNLTKALGYLTALVSVQ